MAVTSDDHERLVNRIGCVVDGLDANAREDEPAIEGRPKLGKTGDPPYPARAFRSGSVRSRIYVYICKLKHFIIWIEY